MLIKLIQESAEKTFLDKLETLHQRGTGRVVLLCAFSKTSLRVTADTALFILKDILHDYDGGLYFCDDGDVVVCWHGKIKEVKLAVINAFFVRYPSELELFAADKLFQFFDTNVQGEDLRLLFRGKLHQQQKQVEAPKPIIPQPVKIAAPIPAWEPAFSDDQQKALKYAMLDRKSRKAPEFLVVEDQDFSRKLLAGLFEQKYRCHLAKDAQQATQLYSEHAPDIVFLDIELPDADGHTLAALFKKYDPDSYIIMVTGNNHVKDIETAKANKVQGYIVKPYNKLKIMGAVDTFITRKKG